MAEVTLGYIDVRPLWYLGGVLLILMVGLPWLGLARGHRRRVGGVLVGFLVVYSVLAWFLLAGPYVGYRVVETRSMAWRVDPAEGRDGRYRVVWLTEPGGPIESIRIESDLVADYLLASGQRRVDVDLRLTKDYGQVRGYLWRRVGDVSWEAMTQAEPAR